jgi:hypothetical protein
MAEVVWGPCNITAVAACRESAALLRSAIACIWSVAEDQLASWLPGGSHHRLHRDKGRQECRAGSSAPLLATSAARHGCLVACRRCLAARRAVRQRHVPVQRGRFSPLRMLQLLAAPRIRGQSA